VKPSALPAKVATEVRARRAAQPQRLPMQWWQLWLDPAWMVRKVKGQRREEATSQPLDFRLPSLCGQGLGFQPPGRCVPMPKPSLEKEDPDGKHVAQGAAAIW
jgi:hypothetical protein